MSTQYIGNNTSGQFNPSYTPAGETNTPINVESMSMMIGGKQVAGYQATYANGTSKWTAQVHTDSLFDNDANDNSTFTGSYNESTKKWTWKPTNGENSINKLALNWQGNGLDRETITAQEIKDSFYNTKGAEATQKKLSGVQTLALQKEVGSLAQLKQNEKFSKLPGVQGKSTADIAVTNEDGSSTGDKKGLNFSAVDLSTNITATKTREKYGNYYYPQDIASNKQDRIIFTMKQSTGRVIDPSIKTDLKNFQRKSTAISGSVTLPITTGIKDLNTVDWQGSRMTPLQAFGAAAAMNIVDAAGTEGKTVTGEAGKALRQAGAALKNPGIGDAINTMIAGQAVQSRNLLSRATGAIANPNMELLFNAPGLRAFDFTFQMSPRQATEARQIKSIINFFKQGMSVKTTSTNIFLKAPNYFEIDYVTFDEDGNMIKHPSIGRIKTCALLSCSVDYTPNNNYMTYSDSSRSMVSYTLTLQFNELDPLYESDYFEGLGMQDSEAPSTLIGF
jgi:hypothetical protein